MLFSIIIPVYNISTYISECIESILSQDFEEYEIILVDDDSKDGSAEICIKYAQRSNIRYVHQENAGPNVARNSGVRLSRGEYILFVDGDDKLSPSALTTLSKHISESDPDIINFSYLFFEDGAGRVIHKADVKIAKYSQFEALTRSFLGQGIAGVCWNKCYRRSLIIENEIWFTEDKLHARDILFTRMTIAHAESLLSISDVLYLSRYRSNSYSRSFSVENIFSALDLADKHVSTFLSESKFEKFKDSVLYAIGRHLRYIVLLSAFRSSSMTEFVNHLNVVRNSRYAAYLYSCDQTDRFFKYRDRLLSLLIQWPFLLRQVATISKLLGRYPY
jgi:glycosyltransferase involved in cell wall biosynthesis